MANFFKSLTAPRSKKSDPERVVILGPQSAGKTTFLYRLKLGEIIEISHSEWCNIKTIEHKQRNYNLWDTSGAKHLRRVWLAHTTFTQYGFFLHPCTDTDDIGQSLEMLDEGIELWNVVGVSHLFIVFTKQDLIPLDKRSLVFSQLRIQFEKHLYARKHTEKMIFTFCDLPGFSSYTGEHVLDIFDILQTTIQERQNNGPRVRIRTLPVIASTPPPEPITENSLRARIEKGGEGEADAESFWRAFLAADLPEWTHRTQLRAGYLILLDTFNADGGVHDAADTFLTHLRRLRAAMPTKVRNTEHRTLTIFWLDHIRLALTRYQQAQRTENWPSRDDFQRVLLSCPQLIRGDLWKDYYSKNCLFSINARDTWQQADLQPLPISNLSKSTLTLATTQPSNKNEDCAFSDMPGEGDSELLVRFAFDVVHVYLTTPNIRRAWLIKQALNWLQTSTLRARAKDPLVPAYSETQAYFWIQVVHSAMLKVNDEIHQHQYSVQRWLTEPLACTDYARFIERANLQPTEWTKYYSAERWESVRARMTFVMPDLMPLPNVMRGGSEGDIGGLCLFAPGGGNNSVTGGTGGVSGSAAPSSANPTTTATSDHAAKMMPSAAYLALLAEIIVLEQEGEKKAEEEVGSSGRGVVGGPTTAPTVSPTATSSRLTAESPITKHAQLLAYLYRHLAVAVEEAGGGGRVKSLVAARLAPAVIVNMPVNACEGGYTRRAFWSHQVLIAVGGCENVQQPMSHSPIAAAAAAAAVEARPAFSKPSSTTSSSSSMTADVARALPQPAAQRLSTQREMHTQTTSTPPQSSSTTFAAFIRRNPHLAYIDLPYCYYTPDLLHCAAAHEAFVPPDKRPLEGFSPAIITISDPAETGEKEEAKKAEKAKEPEEQDVGEIRLIPSAIYDEDEEGKDVGEEEDDGEWVTVDT